MVGNIFFERLSDNQKIWSCLLRSRRVSERTTTFSIMHVGRGASTSLGRPNDARGLLAFGTMKDLDGREEGAWWVRRLR